MAAVVAAIVINAPRSSRLNSFVPDSQSSQKNRIYGTPLISAPYSDNIAAVNLYFTGFYKPIAKLLPLPDRHI